MNSQSCYENKREVLKAHKSRKSQLYEEEKNLLFAIS